jgi:hypothetical protein
MIDQRGPAEFRIGIKRVLSGFKPAHPPAALEQPYGINLNFP